MPHSNSLANLRPSPKPFTSETGRAAGQRKTERKKLASILNGSKNCKQDHLNKWLTDPKYRDEAILRYGDSLTDRVSKADLKTQILWFRLLLELKRSFNPPVQQVEPAMGPAELAFREALERTQQAIAQKEALRKSTLQPISNTE